jgi:two-component system, NtrC family, response regulator AtoC
LKPPPKKVLTMIKNSTILIVDDERGVRQSFNMVLKEHYRLYFAEDGNTALNIFNQKQIDLVLLDILLPDLDGLDLLKQFKEIEPETEIIMVSALKEIASAVRAMKRGAFDYITKPFEVDDLLAVVKRALERKKLQKEIIYLRDELERYQPFEAMVGQSAQMKAVFNLISRVAQAQGPGAILIQGESGTGKELAARAIHNLSQRKDHPFVVVNCAAIPATLMESELFGYSQGAFTGALESRSGKLEIADSGTLFLDDIDLLDINMQARLLRVLQEKEYEKVGSDRVVHVDIKFIAASNKDLQQRVAEGKFREDLFYRLNVFPIELPPLRERKEDIPELLNHFLTQNVKNNGIPAKSFSEKAVQALVDYDWPGNVRELENFVERLFIVSSGAVIRQEDVLPLQRRNTRRETQALKDAVADFERQHIKAVLASVDGRRGEAAKILEIHRNTLTAKINDLEIVF